MPTKERGRTHQEVNITAFRKKEIVLRGGEEMMYFRGDFMSIKRKRHPSVFQTWRSGES